MSTQKEKTYRSETLTYYSKHPYLAIAAILCCVVLLVLFALWFSKSPRSGWGLYSASLSMMLFMLWGLLFLPRWADSWLRPHSLIKKEKQTGSLSDCLLVFFGLLLFCGMILLCLELRRCIQGHYDSLWEYLRVWKPSDSGHYVDIARDWYSDDAQMSRRVQLVFLPGYPLLLRLGHALLGDYLYAGLSINALCMALSGVVGYKLFSLDHDRETALRAVAFFCLMPGSFFFVVPMTESLFLLLSLLTLYLVRNRLWLPAALAGGYAAFTRSLGVVLLVPAVYELVVFVLEQRNKGEGRGVKTLLSALSLLLIPLGLAAYLYINYRVSGDPLRFLVYQKENWSQSLSYFFNTAFYQTGYMLNCLREGDWTTFLGLWLPNVLCFFISQLVLLLGVKKLRPSYSAYAIAYYVIALGATWLLSGPRYLLVLFPIPLSLALLCKRSPLKGLIPVLLALANFAYLLCFINRWQVW